MKRAWKPMLAVGFACAAWPTHAVTVSDNMAVQMTIAASCTITATPTLNFGTATVIDITS